MVLGSRRVTTWCKFNVLERYETDLIHLQSMRIVLICARLSHRGATPYLSPPAKATAITTVARRVPLVHTARLAVSKAHTDVALMSHFDHYHRYKEAIAQWKAQLNRVDGVAQLRPSHRIACEIVCGYSYWHCTNCAQCAGSWHELVTTPCPAVAQ